MDIKAEVLKYVEIIVEQAIQSQCDAAVDKIIDEMKLRIPQELAFLSIIIEGARVEAKAKIKEQLLSLAEKISPLV